MKQGYKILVFGVLILSGCDIIDNFRVSKSEKNVESSQPIARVNDVYLYEKDIQGLLGNDNDTKDSINIVSQYVNSWIRKQLMISRASRELALDKSQIDRKVLDYRYSLMVHEFEKHFINLNLETEITEDEIEKYYKEKFENFVLRENIVRCMFAKIPKQAPQINTFRNQIRSFPKSNLEEIQSYCYRFATKSSLEPELWLNFDEVISSTPLANIQDRVTFLKNNSFIETSDEDYYYYIRLMDYKISDQIAPLEFIKDDIASILVNKNRVALKKKLKEEVYLQAKEKNEFEIYKN